MIFADAVATWSPSPVYLAIQPYLLAAFGTIITALITWAVSILSAHFHLSVDAATRDKVQTAALNAAGRILASQDAKVADMKIDVGSPFIANEIPVVMSLVGDAVKQLGLTPEKIASLIQAKLGVLQATAQGSGAATAVAK